jgi:hypothetical protein
MEGRVEEIAGQAMPEVLEAAAVKGREVATAMGAEVTGKEVGTEVVGLEPLVAAEAVVTEVAGTGEEMGAEAAAGVAVALGSCPKDLSAGPRKANCAHPIHSSQY